MAKGIFGERLKRERELREVTLEEVSKATRISDRFLRALEDEDWGKLPGGVFGRGFVRTIARYLGLNEEALLAEYDNARSEPTAAGRAEERIPSPPKWIPIVIVLGVLVVLLALVYAGVHKWRQYSADRSSAHSAVLQTPADRAPQEQSSSSPVPSSGELDLMVSASANVHARISSDGSIVFDGNLSASEKRHFHASDQFEVSVSDSSSVLLELNGRAMPPVGRPGASGTMVLSRKNLGTAESGNPQP